MHDSGAVHAFDEFFQADQKGRGDFLTGKFGKGFARNKGKRHGVFIESEGFCSKAVDVGHIMRGLEFACQKKAPEGTHEEGAR